MKASSTELVNVMNSGRPARNNQTLRLKASNVAARRTAWDSAVAGLGGGSIWVPIGLPKSGV